jgi:fructose-1,6-bisphosphatase/inositol monophosphatase family enzyme
LEENASAGDTKADPTVTEPINIDDANKAIVDALRGGGKLLTSMFVKNYEWRQKADTTRVTEADFAAQKFIMQVLSERFPGVCVDSEEERASSRLLSKSPLHWILDPLDGTENFATLNPHFGIAIGLVSNDVLVAGGVIQPFPEILFSFGGANGPLMNGEAFPKCKITAATIGEAAVAFIPTVTSQRTDFARRTHATIYRSCRRLIDNWAPSLDWSGLATGRIDAIVSFGKANTHEDFDGRIGKALFQAVWGREAYIEQHLIHENNVSNVLEIASRNPELVSELRVRLAKET